MAISLQEQVDFLWKRLIFGVTKSASSTVKFASNETIPSPLPVYGKDVWSQADATNIPPTPPPAATTVVQPLFGASRVRMTSDPTSPANVAWIAATTFGDTTTRHGDFIPPSFGSGYAAQVWIGDPNVGPAARIFPDTTGEEWVFDYAAGVLLFTGTIPANKPATVGSGSVSVATNGIYVEAYRYVGTKGVGGGGSGGGTMAQQNADAVNITGGAISNVTLINVTVDGGTF
jgi:hypothetical protein